VSADFLKKYSIAISFRFSLQTVAFCVGERSLGVSQLFLPRIAKPIGKYNFSNGRHKIILEASYYYKFADICFCLDNII
jgi:hypothetical protein